MPYQISRASDRLKVGVYVDGNGMLGPMDGDARGDLTLTPKRLPSKYFHDEPGTTFFEQIPRFPEDYPEEANRISFGMLPLSE